MQEPSHTIKLAAGETAIESIIEALGHLVDHQLADDKEKLRGIIATLTSLRSSGAVVSTKPPAALAMPAQLPDPDEYERHFTVWREHLRRQREEAGLTRQQLGDRAGVSESTVKLAEANQKNAAISAQTLRRLLALPELRLNPHHPFVALVLRSGRPQRQAATFTGWSDAEMDPLRCARELQALLDGPGCVIPPHLLAIDPLSANACRQALPQDLSPPWKEVSAHIGSSILDVIGLGSSDGASEVALSLQLLDRGVRDLRLYLIGASHPLLSLANHRAVEALDAVFSLHGDPQRLAHYTNNVLPADPAPRRQLVCLLGGALGLLGDDARFLQEVQAGLAEGSFLLLQVDLGPGEEDPWLCRPLPSALSAWLEGVVRRYGSAVEELEILTSAVKEQGGSYTVQVQLVVRARERPERTFTLLRSRRYDRARLLDSLRRAGWGLQDGWHGLGGRRFTVLLQRRE